MSLVTRCPSCATTFKVVRDQLRISDGWVRCGRCSHVFDATLDLQESTDAAPAASPEDSTDPPAESDPSPSPEPSGSGSKPAPVAAPLPPLWPAGGVLADEPWPSRPAQPVEPMPVLAQASLHSSVEALDNFSAVVDQAASAQLEKALRRARIEAVRSARARRAAQQPEARRAPGNPDSASMPIVNSASATEPAAAPPFAQPASRMATTVRWSLPALERRRNRVLVWMAIGLAALLLALQVVRQERDAIVAQHPSWQPVLQALCRVTGCELAALRRIGDITIDGAAFARDKVGEGYRLGFTLRNGAAVPLAMPSVELSLLDTQERTVVRRVLAPAEFGAPAVLAARSERSASLPLVLTGPEAAALPPVAGYRLVAFYP